MRLLVLISLMFALVASAASADPRHGWRGPSYHHRDPGTAFWGGVLGGLVGNWWTRTFSPPISAPEIVPGTPAWFAYCSNKYRSFDPETGTYLGYDGQRRPCQ